MAHFLESAQFQRKGNVIQLLFVFSVECRRCIPVICGSQGLGAQKGPKKGGMKIYPETQGRCLSALADHLGMMTTMTSRARRYSTEG